MELHGSTREDAPPRTPGYRMLGVHFDLLTTDKLHQAAVDAVESDRRWVIGGHNMHSIYLCHHDPKMRRFYERSHWTFLDGMPLVWLARTLGMPARRAHRHAPVDWMPGLLAIAAEKGWRVFFLGSEPGVGERGGAKLVERFPGLQLRTRHGFFDATPGSAESEAVLAEIREWQPNVLAVCMGMPRQEHWIVDHLDRLEANVIFNLGALMDLFAGELPIPPRWVGQVGMEWLYRLCSHPRRVWRRYLVEPWFLLPHLARDLKRGSHRDTETQR